MKHPVFQNRRTSMVYMLAWIVATAIHVLVLYSFYLDNFNLALTDGVIFNGIFAMLGLSLWYIVGYGKTSQKNLINSIINQITSWIVVLFVWIGLALLVVNVFSENREYIVFVNSSIPWRVISGTFYYFILVLIYYLIIYYRNLNEKHLNEEKLRGMIRETELKLLKSQINPHFLFNSLNSISSLTISDPKRAREMIIKLSDYLRYTVSADKDKLLPLEKEIENAKRYLEIEKVRFGEKLQFRFEIDPQCNQQMIPSMILQPLYENTIKHGVYESSEPIKVQTSCTKHGNHLGIVIRNNFDPEALPKKGTGTGLGNIRERLGLIYGNRELLKTEKKKTAFIVQLMIPINES